MRVLLLDVNCKYSSTGKIVYDLYTELNKNGHTAAIGYGRGKVINEPNILKFSSNTEVYIHALMTRITGFTGCFSYFATKKLIRFIEEFKPDIVHLNDMHGYFVNIISLIKYLKKKKITTIWTLHCEFMYTGKCGHSYDCEKWKTHCEKCPQRKGYPESLFFDFTKKMFYDKKKAFANFDRLTIVTPSNWLADRVKLSILGEKEIHVIQNGIDTNKVFHPRRFEHLKKLHGLTKEKVVLAVASDLLSNNKGGRYVLELARRMRDENVRFILIGVREPRENFDHNVIALGKTDNQDELAKYYSMADVFVICSERENLPTTCLEALSCGSPIIGFDTGGTKETAPEGLGDFVPYGDMDSLYKAVKNCLDRDNSFSIKNACETYALEHYSKGRMYDSYVNLYESKLKERNI